ncbi:MAG: acyltransferase [Nitrospiraceae bacterium]
MRWSEVRERIRFWQTANRLGPDIPYTHWRLHFKSTMVELCKRKFRYFGDGAEFRPGAYAVCCSQISLGKRVVIRPASMLFANMEGGEIIIEDDVMLGSGVHIYVGNHRFDGVGKPIIDQGYSPSKPVVLKKGCWIGSNVIILPGITVGENSVIGAGSVVTKCVPDGVLAVGNPARTIRTMDGAIDGS